MKQNSMFVDFTGQLINKKINKVMYVSDDVTLSQIWNSQICQESGCFLSDGNHQMVYKIHYNSKEKFGFQKLFSLLY